jgi:diguanylate cyclase (GGDEF)-like protein
MNGSCIPVPCRVAAGACLLLLALAAAAVEDSVGPWKPTPATSDADRLGVVGEPGDVQSLARNRNALEVKLEEERDQRRVELLKKDQEIRALEVQRQRLWIGAIATASVLLVAVAVLLFARNRLKERSNAELATAYSRMDEQARSDALTNLANRQAATERLELEVRRTERTHRPLSLLMLDVDDLKRINDERGHVSGDAVLKGLGVFLRSTLRELDLAARWGGEEFLLVLPETSRGGALQIAEKIRHGAEAIRVHDEGHDVSFTVTIGVGTFDERLPVDEYLRRIDGALHEGKRSGKNRVVAG